MTPEFELFYDRHLSKVEGGIVDHNLDDGGATWYGISSGFLEDIGRKGPVSKADAKEIAYDYFWEPNGCQDMAPVAGWSYCDALFNHSPEAAAEMLQHALQVTVDGIVGPRTRKAAKSINTRLFIMRYRVYRTRYYAALVKDDPTQLAFLVGWVDRLNKLNQAMLVSGLLKETLKKLKWYSPARASVNVKAAGFGMLMLTAVVGLFWPDLDISSLKGLLDDPVALKAALISVGGGLMARWRAK